jgi:beta-fructofuranosidase
VAYLFRSQDLEHWEYLHPFYEGGAFTEGGEDCAVPQFLPFEGRHMLLFSSHLRGAQLYLGRYEQHRFTPEYHKRLAFPAGVGRVGVFNEGYILAEPQGGHILFGRVSEARHGYVQRASGWSGMFALPSRLSLDPGGTLRIEPAVELEALRKGHRHVPERTITAGSVHRLEGIRGDLLELSAGLDLARAEECGIKVCCSPGFEEETVIRLRTVRGRLEMVLDAGRSSTNAEVSHRDAQYRYLPPDSLGERRRVDLRLFLDRSIVEVYLAGREYAAQRIYPARADSLGVALYALGGDAELHYLDAWNMEAVWPLR